MKFTVYHAINPNFGRGEQPKFPAEYEQVAEVECNDLEEVFRLTNHIESNWTKNPGVKAVRSQVRSTSVGDVVVSQDGKKWLCDPVGWKEFN